MFNPTVLTAGQEREARGGIVIPGNWKGPNMRKGKGTHMWRLRQEKPHLFDQKDKDLVHMSHTPADKPPGFEPCQFVGMLYNKDKNIYWELATRKKHWFDEVEQVHRPLYEGEGLPCSFCGGAAAVTAIAAAGEAPSSAAPSKSAAAAAAASKPTESSSSASASPSAPAAAAAAASSSVAPKQVLISDLHGVAKALKKDFGHLDRPAGALAIVGAPRDPQGVTLESAARAVPEKLLRRLAAYRSEWTDEELCAALAGSIADVAGGDPGLRPNAAIALVVGDRIVAAAAPGTHIGVCMHSNAAGDDPQGVVVCSPDGDDETATVCRRLGEDDADTLTVSLAVGAGFSNFTASAPHLVNGRPRAASITHLRWMRKEGCNGPLGVGCARLALQLGGSCSSGSAPAAKRQKTEEVTKIRVRQILLRHAGMAKPIDPVRNKKVTRTLEEAEEQMLQLLVEFSANNCANFPAVCKAKSECHSSLKGGALAGDMGWLDRAPPSGGSGSGSSAQKASAMKLTLPPHVLKGAFELQVGELGDIMTSEQGVHLVQRTA